VLGLGYHSPISGFKGSDQPVSCSASHAKPCLRSKATGSDSADASYLSAPRGRGGRAARSQLSKAAMSSVQFQCTIPRASADRFYAQTTCSSLTWRVRKGKKAVRGESGPIFRFLFYKIISLLALRRSSYRSAECLTYLLLTRSRTSMCLLSVLLLQ